MCVIIVAKGKFPSLAVLEAAERANPDGGSVAWIYRNRVFWQKGLTAKQIYDRRGLIGNKGCVIHFRIATVGGAQPLLNHPFQITQDSPTVFQGHSKSVLFHNGHWGEWERHLKAIQNKYGKKLTGPMSDSRAMAIACAYYGYDFAEVVAGRGQKVAILTPKGAQLYGHFTSIQDDLLVSNTLFNYTGKVLAAKRASATGSYLDWYYKLEEEE